jgi:GNAT superfamily N-acetyltransferase
VTASAPESLQDNHDLGGFQCGVASLDDWLKRRARGHQASGASRTFVTCDGNRVVGYYALAAGGVAVAAAPGRFRRNMPDPVPVVLLGRLAVDSTRHGHGFGRALLRDAATRVIGAAETVGIRGIVVHAISDQAKTFYLAQGFEASPLEPMTLMATLSDLKATLT